MIISSAIRCVLMAAIASPLLMACTKKSEDATQEAVAEQAEPANAASSEGDKHDAEVIQLSAAQIAAAGITVEPVRKGSGGSIDVPAVIAADPTRSASVAAAVAGRIVTLQRNLGEAVKANDVLAVIESREFADLTAEVQAAQGQLQLTQTSLEREESLYRERVTAEQDVIAARTAAQAAQIRLNLAKQRLGATGSGEEGTATNRLLVRTPISGKIIARHAAVGDVVAAEAELFRIADLSDVSLELALPADQISAVRPGATIVVATAGRTGTGRITFVSPVIDATTRQVHALATLRNSEGQWRVGETITARVQLGDSTASAGVSVPQTAIQTVEDKPTVFVRTDSGFAVKHLTLGTTSGNDVVVVSGLTGSEMIAVANSYVLKAELGKGEGGDHDD